MIVTIIGSMSRNLEMDRLKEYYENLGHDVNSPNDPGLQEQPLLSIQSKWIEKIREADLIVAIPKCKILTGLSGHTEYTLEFGESTSYELAIAYSFDKEVVFV